MIITESFSSTSFDSSDSVIIPVDGSPSSDLSFANVIPLVEKAIASEKKVCLELFLDLYEDNFSFHDELSYSVRKKSIEALFTTLKAIPIETFSHIILYRGSLDFSHQIQSNAQTKIQFTEWVNLVNADIELDHLHHLFSANLLSTFLHSLGTLLPESIKPVALFSLPQFLPVGKCAEILSEETFPHIEVGLKNPKYFIEGVCWGDGCGSSRLICKNLASIITEDDVKTAVILPFIGKVDYTRFEQVCIQLQQSNTPYKIIEENLLNEKWHEIDTIIFDQQNTTFDGNRMVNGFIAAGGEAIDFLEYIYEDSILTL